MSADNPLGNAGYSAALEAATDALHEAGGPPPWDLKQAGLVARVAVDAVFEVIADHLQAMERPTNRPPLIHNQGYNEALADVAALVHIDSAVRPAGAQSDEG